MRLFEHCWPTDTTLILQLESNLKVCFKELVVQRCVGNKNFNSVLISNMCTVQQTLYLVYSLFLIMQDFFSYSFGTMAK